MDKYDLEELIREDFEERFEDYIDTVGVERRRVEICSQCAEPVSFDDVMPSYRAVCETHGQLTDDQTKQSDDLIELPTYWEDTLFEIADSCTPVYYSDALDVWRDLNCPDPENTALDEGKSILDLILYAVAEYANEYAWELANKYEFN